MAWACDEANLHKALVSGASTLFVGGRRSGATFVARRLEGLLRADEVASYQWLDLSAIELPDNPGDLLGIILPRCTWDALARDDLVAVGVALTEMLAQSARRFYVLVIDRFDVVAQQDWAFSFTVSLRSLLQSCRSLRLAAFCRPRSVDMLGGNVSPLVNMLKRFTATRANEGLVRSELAESGFSAESAMKGYSASGGLPHLIQPAAELFARGAVRNVVIPELARSEAGFFLRQYEELTPGARRLLCTLAMTGSRGVVSIRDALGLADASVVIEELAAYLLIHKTGTEWDLSCPIHRQWLTDFEGLGAPVSARLPLGNGDETAYRELSQLEWIARSWLEQCLGETIGANWWNDVVPEDLRLRVEARQAFECGDQRVAESEHLVDYLDFTDFREILRLKVVWRKSFSGTSIDEWRESLFAALERLEAIRRKVAHSRALTVDEVARVAVDSATVRDVISRTW